MFAKLTRISLLWYYQVVTLTLTHFQLRKSGGNDLIPENPHNDKVLSNAPSPVSDAVQLMDEYSSKEGSKPDPDSLPSLYARFLLEGTPRPALLLNLPLSTPLPRKSYTVLFKYKFHPTGLISHHIVEKIQPAPDLASLFPRVAWWWWFRGAKPEFHTGTS
ncbi:hypothetical protein DSO57_1009932 [Entomophthora muscae]|uniref:Uncharacterized protein n=1 Tax=Entomophthora muscae TaxID=34485 RepID=A0ACC2SVV7_9FUNG|nr:hypothetical protein DSO57_1009932 [Entomophthora muscae]